MRQPAVATTTDHGTRDHDPGNSELWPSKGTHKLKLKAKKPGKVKLKLKVTSKNAGGKTVKKKIKVKK